MLHLDPESRVSKGDLTGLTSHHKHQLTSLDCISAGMTNFNDPDAITHDYRAYIFAAVLRGLRKPTSLVSDDGQTMAHPWRSLHVRLLNRTGTLSGSSYDPYSIPSPSWEFFTTLGYEWNVVRRRLPYLWTIWVCGNMKYVLPLCFLCSGQTRT